MAAQPHEIALKLFAALNQTDDESIRAIVDSNLTSISDLRIKLHYTYADALNFELARQMSDKEGLPIGEALRLIVFSSAVTAFCAILRSERHDDFWLAVLQSRNTRSEQGKGFQPLTGFGKSEYWSELNFAGSLHEISNEISEWIANDRVSYPDSDHSRIVMANVSAADRRLRNRAAKLDIAIHGNQFSN